MWLIHIKNKKINLLFFLILITLNLKLQQLYFQLQSRSEKWGNKKVHRASVFINFLLWILSFIQLQLSGVFTSDWFNLFTQKWGEKKTFLTRFLYFIGHSSMINQLFINGRCGRIGAALPKTTVAPPQLLNRALLWNYVLLSFTFF